jgi:hypothetical protein
MERFVLKLVRDGAPHVRVDVATLDALWQNGRRHPWSSTAEDLRLVGQTHILTGVSRDAVVFELRDPFARGSQVANQPARAPVSVPAGIPTREPWRAPEGVTGVKAAEERWRSQLGSAARGGAEPLVPTGIPNRILTEGLRDFVSTAELACRVDVRVIYRDGSEAQTFPLQSLRLGEEITEVYSVVRVALMSMRHPEMDSGVDAAWFRNRIISIVRPSSETDEVAYDISRTQLLQIIARGPVCLNLYQTGFEPAVVGFYRAVVHHLSQYPGTVAVVPFYYNRGSYQKGRPWAT